MTKCENVARSVCILGLRLHRDTNTHKLSSLNFCTHQHFNLYLLKAVILKETRQVIGQYTHIYTTPLTHTKSIMTFAGAVFASSCKVVHTSRHTHTHTRAVQGLWRTRKRGVLGHIDTWCSRWQTQRPDGPCEAATHIQRHTHAHACMQTCMKTNSYAQINMHICTKSPICTI